MRLLVSGATATMNRLLNDPRTAGDARRYLGHLILPRNGNALASIEATGLPYACDNGCFLRWEPNRFGRMLQRFGPGAEWVAMPDVVGSARGTAVLWDGYTSIYDDAEGLINWALVAQNGLDGLDWDFALGMCQALFIGGDDSFKESREAAALAGVAKRRGKWVHMGRVNTFRRFRIAYEMGCDSVDGGSYSNWPDRRIPEAIGWLKRLDSKRCQGELFSPEDVFVTEEVLV